MRSEIESLKMASRRIVGGNSMENDIRTFLMRISKNCAETDCFNCPFYEEEYDSCVFSDYHPFEWKLDKIIGRYQRIMDGDVD